MSTSETYMKRAIQLAGAAPCRTSPNPPVGAVLVRDGAIVGEGFHAGAGSDHAEVAAIRDAGEAARGSTLYVTLEPCNHVGRTPPCTRAILNARIDRVVYGSPDPNPHVTGGGHGYLLQNGVEVEEGVLRAETDRLIRFFSLHARTGRPWIIGKMATSLDGRIATRTGQSKWITGAAARRRGHELRRSVDAILVGVNTVIADDPLLTVRLPEVDLPCDNPVRIVLDSHGRTPVSSRIFQPDQEPTVHVFGVSIPEERGRAFVDAGAAVHTVPSDLAGRVSLPAVLDVLGGMGIQSLLVEGGAQVLGSFHDQRLFDEIWSFIAPRLIGGEKSLSGLAGTGRSALNEDDMLMGVEIESCPPDVLVKGFVNRNGHQSE